MSLARYSIGIKIFGAFIAMSALIALLGAAGYAVLASAGRMAVTTFDGPLMAINYARAAQSDFILMQMAELRYEHAAPERQNSIAGEITINRGDSLTFTNQDDFIHQVYVSGLFDTDEKAPGQKLTESFPQTGTFEVRCHIHPKMKLVVHVK